MTTTVRTEIDMTRARGSDPVRTKPARRVLLVLGVLALVTAAAAAGWWAARSTLTSPVTAGSEQDAAQVVWAEASTGSVGRSLPLSTTVRQPSVPVAVNTLSGVVTSISPGVVDAGDVIYVVGDTPVRVVEAERPMWRDLMRGAKGADVAALQTLLVMEGHLSATADGDFGAGTDRAVRAWQKAQGRAQTGVVPLGELVAVRDLPATIQLGDRIRVGAALSGGEESVLAPAGAREFVLVVNGEQARLIPAEATIEVTFEGHTWDAVIAGASQDEYSQTIFELTAPDGGEVCGGECDALPSDPQVILRSEVVVIPRVSGTTVPVAAVQTRSDGTAFVVTETGEADVTVSGSGQGVAVVSGIEPGARVRVLSAGDSAPAAPASESSTDAEPTDG